MGSHWLKATSHVGSLWQQHWGNVLFAANSTVNQEERVKSQREESREGPHMQGSLIIFLGKPLSSERWRKLQYCRGPLVQGYLRCLGEQFVNPLRKSLFPGRPKLQCKESINEAMTCLLVVHSQ